MTGLDTRAGDVAKGFKIGTVAITGEVFCDVSLTIGHYVYLAQGGAEVSIIMDIEQAITLARTILETTPDA